VEPTVLLVDAANVVGARPDGWWRDRAGAAERLLGSLAEMRAATVRGPRGEVRVVGGVVAVLEGAARSAGEPRWVRVIRTQGRSASGDDALVAAAELMLAEGHAVLAVTSDRGLRGRLSAVGQRGDRGSLAVCGTRWLLERLEGSGGSGPGRSDP
jgi:CBS domain-containing protein